MTEIEALLRTTIVARKSTVTPSKDPSSIPAQPGFVQLTQRDPIDSHRATTILATNCSIKSLIRELARPTDPKDDYLSGYQYLDWYRISRKHTPSIESLEICCDIWGRFPNLEVDELISNDLRRAAFGLVATLQSRGPDGRLVLDSLLIDQIQQADHWDRTPSIV